VDAVETACPPRILEAAAPGIGSAIYGPDAAVLMGVSAAACTSDAEWQSQLAGQTRLTVSANEALIAVRNAGAHASQAHRNE
jgi:hypothetical protein